MFFFKISYFSAVVSVGLLFSSSAGYMVSFSAALGYLLDSLHFIKSLVLWSKMIFALLVLINYYLWWPTGRVTQKCWQLEEHKGMQIITITTVEPIFFSDFFRIVQILEFSSLKDWWISRLSVTAWWLQTPQLQLSRSTVCQGWAIKCHHRLTVCRFPL